MPNSIHEIIASKNIKAKQKVKQLADWLLNEELLIEELLAELPKFTSTNKATCIEAIEFATKKNAVLATESNFKMIATYLANDEPRIKWESAKTIANLVGNYHTELTNPIKLLLINATHNGTVVRWASALALSEIIKLKTSHNKTLIPKIEKLISDETDDAIKKKYVEALKKATK